MFSAVSITELLPVGLVEFEAVGVPEEDDAEAEEVAEADEDAPDDDVADAVTGLFSQCLVLIFFSQFFRNNKQGNEAIQHTCSRSRSRSRWEAF